MVGKWADVEDDDVPVSPANNSNIIVSGPDAQGIKTIVEYTERNGKNYKTTRRVKETVVTKRVSRLAEGRRNLAKFLVTEKLENVELMRAVGEDVKIEPRKVERKEDNIEAMLGGGEKKSVWTKFRGPGAVPLADTGREEKEPEAADLEGVPKNGVFSWRKRPEYKSVYQVGFCPATTSAVNGAGTVSGYSGFIPGKYAGGSLGCTFSAANVEAENHLKRTAQAVRFGVVDSATYYGSQNTTTS